MLKSILEGSSIGNNVSLASNKTISGSADLEAEFHLDDFEIYDDEVDPKEESFEMLVSSCFDGPIMGFKIGEMDQSGFLHVEYEDNYVGLQLPHSEDGGSVRSSVPYISGGDLYLNMCEFGSCYRFGKLINSGGTGSVYSAEDKMNGSRVAIKVLRKAHVDWWYDRESEIPMEVECLAKCQDLPGVIKLHEYFVTSNTFIIVQEHPEDSVDLVSFLTKHNGIEECLARIIFRRVISAVIDIHSRGVVHRDLKCENILVHLQTGHIKIIDFGCANNLVDIDGENAHCIGTHMLNPPEWHSDRFYHPIRATVWTLGIILYEMLCKKVKAPLPIPVCCVGKMSKGAKNLMQSCLNEIPELRPTFEQILEHSWLTYK